MVLGVDIGNCTTKLSTGLTFESKVSKRQLLNQKGFIFQDKTYYIGDGNYETEYRKVNKKNTEIIFAYLTSLFYEPLRVVVGLPILQYQQDCTAFREKLLNLKIKNVIGVEVYPEGIGTIDSGIVIDIGGRTTDCALIRNINCQKKIENPISLPTGTFNLYSEFIKALNSRFCLDLKVEDAQEIIKNGLIIDGVSTDIRFAAETFKSFVEQLVNTLNIEYSLRSKSVVLVGGGSQLLSEPLLKRIPGAILHNDCIFANAKAFREVGEQIWQR